MAGDTRDPSPQSSSPGTPSSATPPPPPPPSAPNKKRYETFTPSVPNANALPPGAGMNTAGHHATVPPSLSDGVSTIRMADFKQVHMYPCVRESLLVGIGGAFGFGGVKMVLGGPVFTACTWAVAAFGAASAANYEYCQYKRRVERTNIKRVIEVMDKKREEKRREAQAKAREAAGLREKEEAERIAAAKKASWKFW